MVKQLYSNKFFFFFKENEVRSLPMGKDFTGHVVHSELCHQTFFPHWCPFLLQECSLALWLFQVNPHWTRASSNLALSITRLCSLLGEGMGPSPSLAAWGAARPMCHHGFVVTVLSPQGTGETLLGVVRFHPLPCCTPVYPRQVTLVLGCPSVCCLR